MFKQHSIKNRAQVGPVSATTLDQAVDQAEETYHTFRVKLMSLISTLKTHHEAMQKLSSSQIEATNSICDLLIDTPLTKCAFGTNHGLQTEASEHDQEENVAKTVSTSSKDQSDGPETLENAPNIESPGDGMHSFDSVIGHGKNLDEIDESFQAIFNASNDVDLLYAKRYIDWIIGYLLQWDEIVNTRIEGRLIEFRQMRQKYAHYTGKVQGLHVKMDRQKAKRDKSPPSPRLTRKMDRNIIKLSGAEEAHNDFGRSLLSLIEEVTGNYWKDLVPLLHLSIQFHINHSADLATVMAQLEKTDETLKNISKQHGVSVTGRLEELRPEVILENIKVVEAPQKEEKNNEEKEHEAGSAHESQSLESV